MTPSKVSGPTVVVILFMVAACGASPAATSGPRVQTAAVPPSTVPTVAVVTTTAQPVTASHTTLAPTTALTAAADDPGDLYALDLAFSAVSRLTTDPRLDGAPAWMPDGERLLFGRLVSGTDQASGNTDIFLVAANGTAEQRLTEHPANDVTPRPSPDATSVVFASDRAGNWEIYLPTLHTGQLRRLTNDAAADRFPAFSPDGHTIVFNSDRGGGDDVFLMDVTGSQVRRLTTTPGTDWLAEYSPDGATIAFATDHSIDLMDADGTNRRTVNADAANHPSWSPDGRRIAAVTRTARVTSRSAPSTCRPQRSPWSPTTRSTPSIPPGHPTATSSCSPAKRKANDNSTDRRPAAVCRPSPAYRQRRYRRSGSSHRHRRHRVNDARVDRPRPVHRRWPVHRPLPRHVHHAGGRHLLRAPPRSSTRRRWTRKRDRCPSRHEVAVVAAALDCPGECIFLEHDPEHVSDREFDDVIEAEIVSDHTRDPT